VHPGSNVKRSRLQPCLCALLPPNAIAKAQTNRTPQSSCSFVADRPRPRSSLCLWASCFARPHTRPCHPRVRLLCTTQVQVRRVRGPWCASKRHTVIHIAHALFGAHPCESVHAVHRLTAIAPISACVPRSRWLLGTTTSHSSVTPSAGKRADDALPNSAACPLVLIIAS